MKAVEIRQYEMLARVREFSISHPAAFPAGSYSAELLARLNTIVVELSAHHVSQTSGRGLARSGGSGRTVARDRLLASLRAMRRTALEVGADRPGLDQQFRLPTTGGDQALVSAAHAFMADAQPLRSAFERRQLGADFFTQLVADIDAFDQSLAVQRRGREARLAATAAIGETLADGRRTVRSLDTIMRNQFAADPLTLRAWRSACHVQARRGRGTPTPESPAPPATGPRPVAAEPVDDAA